MSNDINNRKPRQRHQLQTSGLISPVRRRILQAGIKAGAGLAAVSALLQGQALAQLIPHGMWRNRATTTTTTLPPAGTAGTLWGAGSNGYGQLGIGTTDDEIVAQQVGILTNWTQISAGANHSLGLLSNGTLWSWGGNVLDSSMLRPSVGGQLGQGDLVSRSSPVQIAGSWKMCAAGAYASFGIKTDGTLWGWGLNDSGWLGLPLNTHPNSPVQIGSDTWSSIGVTKQPSALYMNSQYYFLFSILSGIKTNGTLWELGFNINQYLPQSSPVQLPGSWTQTTCSSAAGAAIKTDGTLWVRGLGNNYGQLGNGTATDVSSPVQLAGSWKQVAMGLSATGMIKTDGTLWMAGKGTFLGQGNTIDRSSPVQVSGSWSQITIGNLFSTGIRSNGTLWAWGLVGLIGGSPVNVSSPVQISGSWIQASAWNHLMKIKV